MIEINLQRISTVISSGISLQNEEQYNKKNTDIILSKLKRKFFNEKNRVIFNHQTASTTMTVLFQNNSLGLSAQHGSKKYSIMTHFPEKTNCIQHSEPDKYLFLF
jgi:hypothetical protein